MQVSKQETPFRIGGVYRQRDGVLVQLGTFRDSINEPGAAWARRVEGFPFGEGFRYLIDGRDTGDWWQGARDLTPGELTQTDSGWVALGVEEESELPELVKNFIKRTEGERFIDLDAAHDALDAAMIARDGEKPPASFQAEPPKSKALPACVGLSIGVDLLPSTHQVRPAFGTAHMVEV